MISPWQIAFEQNEIIPVCFQLLKIYRNDFDFLKSYRYDFNVLYSKFFSKSYRYDFKKLKSFRYIFNFRNRTEKPFNMTSLAQAVICLLSRKPSVVGFQKWRQTPKPPKQPHLKSLKRLQILKKTQSKGSAMSVK